MSWSEIVFGHRLRSDEEQGQQIGSIRGVGVLGLDALASAAYGPEAALTVLASVGALAFSAIVPLTGVIIALLVAVYFSYRQTIAAYPDGGGSYTVASQNLGCVPGMLAASALALDYILNVAVAIAAGVGAVVSAIPALLPYTLPLCLGILLLLTIINLRGIREAGLLLMAPTWLFVGVLLLTIVVGVFKAPVAEIAPHRTPAATEGLGLWVLLRAFANGTTAMTGVEAVSNAVPLFREPQVKHARRTLSLIIAILIACLAGIAYLAHAYHIAATEPGKPGYESVLSQLVAAVMGRGVFYYVAIAAILTVLCLSANTSFADFPRLCRLLALDGLMPPSFAHRGARLVFTQGIVLLSVLACALLVAFGGITDRLIPLFAIGAISAFSWSQWGMVAHWKGRDEPGALRSLIVNAVGATATTLTLVVVLVSKLTEGAWVSVLVVAGFVTLLWHRRSRARRLDRLLGREAGNHAPLALGEHEPPIVIVPINRLDRVARKALAFAMAASPAVEAVQVLTDDPDRCDLRASWRSLVIEPARAHGIEPPLLTTLESQYRELFTPLLDHIRQVATSHPDRFVAVVIPELVQRRWWHRLFRTRPMVLKALLRYRGGPQVVIIDAPWHMAKP